MFCLVDKNTASTHDPKYPHGYLNLAIKIPSIGIFKSTVFHLILTLLGSTNQYFIDRSHCMFFVCVYNVMSPFLNWFRFLIKPHPTISELSDDSCMFMMHAL